MANALALDLSPGLVSAAGQSVAVDISSARNVVRLTARRLAAVGSGSTFLALETSDDGLTHWRQLGKFELSGELVKMFGIRLSRWIRVTWSLDSLTSVTLSITGEAESAYCDPEDVTRLSLPDGALDGVSIVEQLDSCLAASDECEGYLAAAYTMPILKWSGDLRIHCAKMAVRYTLDRRGWDPEQGRDNVIEVGFDRAIKWLKLIAEGLVRPPGIIDSAPEVFEAGSVVMSRPSRRDGGW